MDKCCKMAALYVSSLRALALVHQYSHWTTKGDSFYGDHLLFEKLYDSALEDVDLAAEKFIGIFGAECVDFSLQAEALNKVLTRYKNKSSSPHEMSLAIELDIIKLSKDAYDCFEKENRLTLGLDDMIMSLASKREEAVYLLKQALEK